ncbi:MAG: hypothetical protein ABJE95_09680 [Byssovorax sp.]
MHSKRAIPLAAAVFGGFLCACSRPEPAPTPPLAPLVTERVTLIKSAEAPFINELEDDESAAEIGRAGTALLVVKNIGPLKWKANMGEVAAERDGPMADVKMAPGDGILYGFRSDFGDEIDMPTTAAICAQVATNAALPAGVRQPRCQQLLRRYHLPSGAVAAFDPCATGPCVVAVVRNGVVSSLAIDGVTTARLVPGEGDGTLLVTSRWIRADGAWSGSRLVPVSLAGATPTLLAEIPIDEVDARDPKTVSSRSVRVDFVTTGAGTVVHLVGDQKVKARDDGHDLSTKPIDETHRLAAK